MTFNIRADDRLQSIEVLDLSTYPSTEKDNSWELYQILSLEGRFEPVVCPISDSKILILGGECGALMTNLAEAALLDADEMTVKTHITSHSFASFG